MIVALNATYSGSKAERPDGIQVGDRGKRMKITKSKLVQIIKEEIDNVTEGMPAGDEFGDVEMDKYWIDRDENSHGLPRMGDPETSSQELIIALGVLAKELGTSKEKIFNHLMSLTQKEE